MNRGEVRESQPQSVVLARLFAGDSRDRRGDRAAHTVGGVREPAGP